jgi:hypothetical protein
MFSKKTVVAATLLLLVSAGAVAGASQIVSQQEPPAVVVQPPGAVTDAGEMAPGVPAAPALPASVGQVLYSESFDGAKLDGWRALSGVEARWAVQDGRLQQWGTPDSGNADAPTILVTNNTGFSDGIFEAQVFPTSGSPVGVVFRGSDAAYYQLTMFKAQEGLTERMARLDRIENGQVTEVALSKDWAGFQLGAWQRVEINMAGSRIAASVDGHRLFEVADEGLQSGWVGVWTFADRGADFDNVRIQSVPAGR